jgi:hypothetical protein
MTLKQLELNVDTLSYADQVSLLKYISRRMRSTKALDMGRDAELDALARDPAVQREIAAIEAEFAVAESDGLEGL